MNTSKTTVSKNLIAEPSKLTVTTTINRNTGGSIAETLAIKDRSKNGSEPIGGLSKGYLKIQDSKENNDPTSTKDQSTIKSHSMVTSPTFTAAKKELENNAPVSANNIDSIDPEEQEDMNGD